MLPTRRNNWLFLLLTLALFVLLSHLLVDHLTREPPNYNEIEPGFFLSGFVTEPPSGTEAVLNLCETEDPYRVAFHRWQPICDCAPAPTLDWLREQVQFIDTQRREGRTIYVHCRNGVSRSGMVTVAYFMWRNGWSREEAMAFVRSRREGLRPNSAFIELLFEWEAILRE